MNLGERLRWLRKADAGYTLRDLSRLTGLSIGYLSDLERGRTLPSLGVLDHIAAAYALSLSVLLDGVHLTDAERETEEVGKMADEQHIEQAIQATKPTGLRLTPADIDACIISEDYYRFPGTTVTVCCLTLENGYCVVGESAVLSEENFSAEIGRQVARAEARNKIWALEGYLAKQRMREEGAGTDE